MTSYIHAVKNEGSRESHLIVLSPQLDVSYDLVLGPGERVQYDKLLGEGATAVPQAEDAHAFESYRIKLRSGAVWFSIYECKGKVRCVKGDAFDANAPAIGGHPDYPTIELVVNDDTVRADYYPMLVGPGLVYTSWGTDSYGIYGRGDEENLVQKWTNGSSWRAWEDLKKPPAGLAGPVAAVSWVAQRYSIFALGKDGNLYERSWLTNFWEEWKIHTPPVHNVIGISAVCWIAGRFGIFVTTTTGDVYEKYWLADHWTDWSNLGRPGEVSLTGPITAVCYSGSRYAVYALGNDGNVWEKWWAPTGWSGWSSTGAPPSPVTIKSLSSVCLSDRTYVIAAGGSDNNLWVHRYQRGWYGWENYKCPAAGLNGTLAAGLEATGSGRNYCYYACGSDGAIYLYPGWRLLDGR